MFNGFVWRSGTAGSTSNATIDTNNNSNSNNSNNSASVSAKQKKQFRTAAQRKQSDEGAVVLRRPEREWWSRLLWWRPANVGRQCVAEGKRYARQMHVTPTFAELLNGKQQEQGKAMASLNAADDEGNNNNNNSTNNNNTNSNHNNNVDANQQHRTHSRNSNATTNNNNNEPADSSSATTTKATTKDAEELKLKRQTLEQRKQDLERQLSEKNWLLQQIQKQEAHMLNGNADYANLHDLLAALAQQYKLEQAACGATGAESILRRKHSGSASKENQINNNNNNNRQSEISNRSSEYDNYPMASAAAATTATGVGMDADVNSMLSGSGGGLASGALKSSMKKRATPTPSINLNYIQVQHAQRPQPQHPQQQQQSPHQQQQQQYYQYVTQQQQQQQYAHYQQQRSYQRQLPPSSDTISLYSLNSASVATLRQQHVAPQQQPIIVQCDKYYLSPTQQCYSDGGGFIKSSQSIKRYVSPLASPNLPAQAHLPLQQLQPHHSAHLAHLRQLDAISLAPSYISLDAETALHQQMRWRSTSNLPPPPPPPPTASAHSYDNKSHSSDMLAANYYTPLTPPAQHLKAPPLDDISIASLLNESTASTVSLQKKSKPKQWLESSLDGPVIRAPLGESSHAMDVLSITSSGSTSAAAAAAAAAASRLAVKHAQLHAARGKLSSQSMSSGRHYSMSATHHKSGVHGVQKLLQDDDGRRYAKLSQSTSQLNAMDALPPPPPPCISISAAYALDTSSGALEIPSFKCLPPKGNTLGGGPTPPPRPPPPPAATLHASKCAAPPPLPPLSVLAPALGASAASARSPDIRIESPKNMTVVQQATFQPYKEVTKPFEMSDFYKYSTKYRQKEAAGGSASHNNND